MTKIVEWAEPWFEAGELRGLTYPSDEAALDDFLITHWATVKEIFQEGQNAKETK